jgi:saccharopine dehydrogenase (NAD+, L-lysine forming)
MWWRLASPIRRFSVTTMHGPTCAGLWVSGIGKDGQPREVYLYHVVDNADTMRDYGAQCVVWQTAINPVIAWSCSRTAPGRAPAYSVPRPSMPYPSWELLGGEYGSPWGLAELSQGR